MDWNYVLVSAAVVFLYMTCVFVFALLKKDNSIVDAAWGFGFFLVTALTLVKEPGITSRQILVLILVSFWSFRLSLTIFFRNRGRGEDFRYAKWREDWGNWVVLRSYFQVFILQGLIMLIVALPIVLVNQSQDEHLNGLDVIGLLLWLLGYFFEAVGDFQLLSFKRIPANERKIMQQGLWRYTRHPNYFGEAAMWWGLGLIALSVPAGWMALLSPLLLTFLLAKVSGIPMLEKKYADNPEFREYARRTPVFIPWFPKK